MRILWQSPALWLKTGYAAQSKVIIPHLIKMGHEVVVATQYGLSGSTLRWNGILHLPPGKDSHGNDIVLDHFHNFKCDILVTVGDGWLLRPQVYGSVPWLNWLPIDDDPVSPELITRLVQPDWKPYGTKILPYSKWGVSQLAKEGVKAEYLPEAIDTETLRPMDKRACKDGMGFKDEFIVGMVAANVGLSGGGTRKAFDKNIEGFAIFSKKYPNSKLYLHTNMDATWRGVPALDILATIELLSRKYPHLKKKVSYVDQYKFFVGLPEEVMPEIYNSFDVLLASSMAEGFGLPILEAQSCGVPVITTDFSSMPELTKAGWKVKVKDWQLTGRNSRQAIPDEQDIAEKLELAFKADRVKLGKEAREFAVEFSPEKLANEYWKPLLEEVEQEIKEKNGRDATTT